MIKTSKTVYDLILMDVQMPILDGMEATKQLCAYPGCRQTPIIAMTAKGFAEDRRRCLAAGMNDSRRRDPATAHQCQRLRAQAKHRPINGRFTIRDALSKLHRLYPQQTHDY